MKGRFLYMKFLGLLMVIIGFSYCLTSFNNFFSYIFKTRIFEENLNIFIMSLGLITPLSLFIYGVYFYFYTDFNITKISKLVLGFNLYFLIFGSLMGLANGIQISNNLLIIQVFRFLHESFSYLLLIISCLGIYGCFKYKY